MMERRVIGTVTVEEKKQIENLFERKNGLGELLLIISGNNLLDEETKNNTYEKVIVDMGKTKTAFDKWWTDMQNKYQWPNINGYSYHIDFVTNEIILGIDEK